jgi:hypothetical protein
VAVRPELHRDELRLHEPELPLLRRRPGVQSYRSEESQAAVRPPERIVRWRPVKHGASGDSLWHEKWRDFVAADRQRFLWLIQGIRRAGNVTKVVGCSFDWDRSYEQTGQAILLNLAWGRRSASRAGCPRRIQSDTSIPGWSFPRDRIRKSRHRLA